MFNNMLMGAPTKANFIRSAKAAKKKPKKKK